MDVDPILFYTSILGVLMLGTMSPGPSFVLVARTSVALSRGDGLAAALGMGLGGMLFSILAMLGVQAVLQNMPLLYLSIKILGGLYLINMAIQVWRSANVEFIMDKGEVKGNHFSAVGSFRVGLFTQLSNPKTAIYYGSIFSALLPNGMSVTSMIVMAVLIFVLEAGWYSIVALVLSSNAPRKVYLAARLFIDRLAATVIALLGVKLIAESAATINFTEFLET